MTTVRLIPAEEQFADSVKVDVVETLERLLAEAKAGKISGLAVAATHPDGTFEVSWTRSVHFALLLGAVMRLGYRINEDG